MKVRPASGGFGCSVVRLFHASPRRETRIAVLAGFSLAASFAASPCRADECKVEVEGAMTLPWRDALEALAPVATGHGDCARIRLALANDAARLTFVTTDGRSAERELQHPSELGPTVEALLVAGVRKEATDEPAPSSTIVATPPTVPTSESAPLQSSERLEDKVDDAASRSGGSARASTGAHFGLGLGFRTEAEGLSRPVLAGSGVLAAGGLELGIWGAYEFKYFALGGADEPGLPEQGSTADQSPSDPAASEPDRKSSAVVAGISVGHRVALRYTSLIGSGRLGVAALQHPEADRRQAEFRVGAGLGATFPPRARLRLRADLTADVVPYDVSSNDATTTLWWALGGLLGIEVGGS
jgi:hypothetical protein